MPPCGVDGIGGEAGVLHISTDAAQPIAAGDAAIVWQQRDDAGARAAALDAGVDDVVGPWMDTREIVARLERAKRRVMRWRYDAPPIASHIACGDLQIALVDRQVRREGRAIPLIAREYALLTHMAQRPGQLVSRQELLRDVWRLRFDPGTNSVEVHMSRLRAKLDRGFSWPMLHTVRGAGYVLRPQGG